MAKIVLITPSKSISHNLKPQEIYRKTSLLAPFILYLEQPASLIEKRLHSSWFHMNVFRSNFSKEHFLENFFLVLINIGHLSVWVYRAKKDDVIYIVLVSLLLTVDIFHTFSSVYFVDTFVDVYFGRYFLEEREMKTITFNHIFIL